MRKVAQLIRKYGLEGFGAELEAAWTGDGVERRSLRDLADAFNRRLLERSLLDAGVTAMEGEIDHYYSALTDEDESEAVRGEVRQQLEDHGIDVDELESDFVTYQAIRTYLQDDRGAEFQRRSDADQIEAERDAIERLLSRTSSVTETKIAHLRDTERIDVGEFELFLEVDVLCSGCGTQYSVQELFDRGGCECGG